ncbi:MAG: hypothetical protein HYZ54_07885 [Ignavibacteriae bacterium]|nr:hypothetical protein [Ignavibacteriota bacterium]
MNNLYRIIALAVLILGISSSDCSAWYRLSAKNGGPNGYNYSYFKADAWGTFIKCEGAGYEKLPTKAMRDANNKQWIDKRDQDAANYAMDMMRKGQIGGKVKLPSGRIVEWKKTATEIQISVD